MLLKDTSSKLFSSLKLFCHSQSKQPLDCPNIAKFLGLTPSLQMPQAYRFNFGFCTAGCGAGLEKAVLLLTGTELFFELVTWAEWLEDDLGLLLLIFLSSISSNLLHLD